MMDRDYYKMLEVAPSADAEEIRRSYRRLARRFHPDVTSDPAHQSRFHEITEAYEVLRDPQKRAVFDLARDLGTPLFGKNQRPPHQQPPSTKAPKPADPPKREPPPRREPEPTRNPGFGTPMPPRGATMRGTLELTLAESLLGAEKRILLALPTGGEQEVTLYIPAGTREGESLRVTLPGSQGQGELLLVVEVKKDPRFRRDEKGLDLDLELDLPLDLALLGGPLEIPTLEEPHSVILLPMVATKGDHVITLRGQGAKDRSGKRGDLRARMRLCLPTDLSETALDLLQRFAREVRGQKGNPTGSA